MTASSVVSGCGALHVAPRRVARHPAPFATHAPVAQCIHVHVNDKMQDPGVVNLMGGWDWSKRIGCGDNRLDLYMPLPSPPGFGRG